MPDCTRLARPSTVILVACVLQGCSDPEINGVESSQTTIPVDLINNRPVIEIQVNGTPVRVLFDLGSAETLRLNPSVLAKIDKVETGEVTGVRTLYGPEAEKPAYRVDFVQIGDHVFFNALVMESFHDLEHQADVVDAIRAYGSIGLGYFEDYKIVLSYPSSEMTFIKPTDSAGGSRVCYGDEIPMLPVEEAGVLTEARTEVGDIRFVWDTGAVPNILFKSRADRENLSVSDRNTVVLGSVDN